jgi:hypothetical protein
LGNYSRCSKYNYIQNQMQHLYFRSQIIRPTIYCAIFTLITLGFATWNLTNFYITASQMPNYLVAGSIQELMQVCDKKNGQSINWRSIQQQSAGHRKFTIFHIWFGLQRGHIVHLHSGWNCDQAEESRK